MDAVRRRRRSAAAWRAVLERFEASGLTTVAFCEREGIGSKSLYRWRSRLGSARELPAPRQAVGATNTAGFVDLGTLSSRSSRVELRLDLGGGVILQIARG
jgi:transposase-like protein